MIAPGTRIGHYLIEKRLGAGGMGEVFRAFDESLERPVAIKVLPQIMERNQEARARMLREARAASALVHPGIVTVHEVDEHEGSIFLVMEMVVGETFTQLLARRGKLPPGEALKLVRPVAAALEFAHKASFVHRDIKCSNLMVTDSGHVKVLDFGLSKRIRREPAADAPAQAAVDALDTVGMRKGVAARLAAAAGEVAAAPADAATRPGSGVLGGRPPSMPSHDVDATGPTVASLQRKPSSNDDLTMVGAAMGTPGYSALELMDGLEADGRADVFSLGVVLYELLTAARPFSGATWADVRNEVAAERYRRARELVPSLSSELDAVIEQALRANRDVRTPSVGALVLALAHASAAPRRRRRAMLVIGAAAAVSGGAWGILHYARGASTVTAPADATVVVPGPLTDADAPDDGDAAIVDALAPVQLTRLDGCAFAPAFLDDDRVAFELTLPGSGPDIHLSSLADGTTSQITREPTDERGAGAGLTSGELIYLVTDHDNPTRSSLVARDLSTGGQREIAPGAMIAAVAARGAYYFVPRSGAELRRMRGKIDEQVARLPGMAPESLTASPDGRWLALVGRKSSQARDVCLFDLDRRTLRCANRSDALAGRADFGAGGALYYGADDGIRTRSPADGPAAADRVVIPGVLAHGGVAVSPGGRTLVYSACVERSTLRDVSAAPAVSLTDDETVASPIAGPDGRIAWVNAGGELFVRFPDGEIRRIAGQATRGGTVGDPAFDAAGETLVFAGSKDAGIVSVALREGAVPTPLTRQPGDSAPLYLNDGSVVFTRMSGATPHVYRIRPGADPARARPAPRRTIDVDRANGHVLLRAHDSDELFWWNPTADTEIPGPPVPGVAGITDISISPDGAWLLYQAGSGGRELWRSAKATGQLDQVYVAPVGTTVSRSAITDEGHALIAETALRGELWRLDAGATPW